MQRTTHAFGTHLGRLPSRHVYDVIVVGRTVSGGITSALLAQRSLRVLLVPTRSDASTSAQATVPRLLPPLSRAPAFAEVAKALGADEALQRHPVSLHVLSRGTFLMVPGPGEQRDREFARVLGAKSGQAALRSLSELESESQALTQWLQEVPGFPIVGMLERWRYQRTASRHFPGVHWTPHESLVALQGLVPILGNAAPTDAVGVTWLLGQATPGAFAFPHGQQGLAAHFVRCAAQAGAEVLDSNYEIGAVEMSRGRFTGIRLAGNPTLYRGAAAIWADDVEALSKLGSEFEAAKPPPRSEHALLSIVGTLDKAAIPRGLGPLSVVAREHGAPMVLQFETAGTHSEGIRSATRPFVLSSVELRSAGEPGAVESMLTSLDDVLPFFRRGISEGATAHFDLEGADHPLYAPLQDAPDGLVGIPPISKHKGFLFANRQVLPGLGIDGLARSAQRAVAAVLRSLGRRDAMRPVH